MKRTITYIAILVSIAAIALAMASAAHAANMQDYCQIPPSIKRSIPPNVMIIMDNTQLMGSPVYDNNFAQRTYYLGDSLYNATIAYGGFFKSELWYSYSGTMFKPDQANGIFDGNLLNFVATSRYDLVESIIVGGKSTSRQTNVNRLIGINMDGSNTSRWWANNKKIYDYYDILGTHYICEFYVDTFTGDLIIRDNATAKSTSGVVCGLILAGAKRPATGYFYATKASAEPAPSTADMALADDSPGAGIMADVFGVFNNLISYFASDAEAAPLKLTKPQATAQVPVPALPDATLGTVYGNYQCTASGGSGFYRFTASALPSGMQITPDGLINGTPSSVADVYKWNVTITVRDYTNASYTVPAGGVDSVIATLKVTGLKLISPPSQSSLSDAIRFTSYTYQPVVIGNAAGVTWSISNLPSGLSYNSSTGLISGSATASSGAYNGIVISATSGGFTSTVNNISIKLIGQDVTIAGGLINGGSFLPDITRYTNYLSSSPLTQLTAIGGATPYTWTITGLPAGMLYDSATGKIYNSTNVPVGTYSGITITVTGAAGSSSSATVKVRVVGTPVTLLAPASGYSMPDGTSGSVYPTYQPQAVGGSGSFTWTVTGLPSGLSAAADGTVSGTPDAVTSVTTKNVTFKVCNASYSTECSQTTVTLRIIPAGLLITFPDSRQYNTATGNAYYYGGVLVNNANYPDGIFQLKAKNAMGPLTWSAPTADTSRSLSYQTGLSIDPTDGTIYGTVNVGSSGYYTKYIVLQVTDGFTTSNVLVAFYIIPSTYAYSPSIYAWSCYDPLTSSAVGVEFNGCAPTVYYPYSQVQWSWSTVPGYETSYPVPTGLTIDQDTGLITGTPLVTDVGSHYVRFKAVTKDYYGTDQTLTYDLFFSISSVGKPQIVRPKSGQYITGTSYELPIGHEGVPYIGYTATATGGTGSYYWDAGGYYGITEFYNGTNYESTGLIVNSSTGAISGTPKLGLLSRPNWLQWSSDHYYQVYLYSKDPITGIVDWNTYDYTYGYLHIDDYAPVINTPETDYNTGTGVGVIGITQGVQMQYLFAATGGNKPYTWALTNVPSGITFDTSTGMLSMPSTGVPPIGNTVGVLSLVDSMSRNAVSRSVLFKVVSSATLLVNTPVSGTSLPDATENIPYNFSASAVGGTGSYSWALFNCPSGLSASANGLVTGSPSATGSFACTIRVTDNVTGKAATSNFSMNVAVSSVALNSAHYNIIICAGDYTTNCDTPGTTELKHGLLQDYADQARWGLVDFTGTEQEPVRESCIPASPMASFYTSVENALPIDGITKLINSEYLVIQQFKNEATGNNSCDPFAGDPDAACRLNFILILTDGSGANTGSNLWRVDDLPGYNIVECDKYSANLSRNACYGYRHADLRPDVGDDGERQYVSTYIVNLLGDDPTTNAILTEAAKAGGGSSYWATDPALIKSKIEQALKDIMKRASSGTAATVVSSSGRVGSSLMQAVYYPVKEFDSPDSTLDIISWIGRLSNFWYYLDPFFARTGMYDDYDRQPGDGLANATGMVNSPLLDINYDLMMVMNTGGVTGDQPMVIRFSDTNHDEVVDTAYDPIPLEQAIPVFEAGKELWARDLSTKPRAIYAFVYNTTTSSFYKQPFNTSWASSNFNLFDAGTAANAVSIANYIIGYDQTGMRDRSIAYDYNNNQSWDGASETTKKPWRLGDILTATPRLYTGTPPVDYCSTYRCVTSLGNTRSNPSINLADYEQFVKDPLYQRRGLVFTGANDGMLHAFYLGVLNNTSWDGKSASQKARYESDARIIGFNGNSKYNLGDEVWAFIPWNALPYLKYQSELNYCHIYTVDLAPSMFDAAVECPANPGANFSQRAECARVKDNWRSILVGGMRLGGACRNATATCANDMNGDGTVDTKDCVRTPIADIGYSSYFAIDVTDPVNPTPLWEFSDPSMGFATTGPAMVHLAFKNTTTGDFEYGSNGYWYLVIGSGPTGPIDRVSSQFLGKSNQEMELFVLDLKTGKPVSKTYFTGISNGLSTGIYNGFAGNLMNKPTDDQNMDFMDDALYFGYTTCTNCATITSSSIWNSGGVMRVLTNDNADPGQWAIKPLLTGTGSITAGLGKLTAYSLGANPNAQWIYAGSGRYFYVKDGYPDDPNTQQKVMGIKDPCYVGSTGSTYPYKTTADTDYNAMCATPLGIANLLDVTSTPYINSSSPELVGTQGWYMNLLTASPDDKYWAQRVITDITSSPTLGIVLISVYRPYVSKCKTGGITRLYAFDFASGGFPESRLKGNLTIQLQSVVHQITLQEEFGSGGADTQIGTTGYTYGVGGTYTPTDSEGEVYDVRSSPIARVGDVTKTGDLNAPGKGEKRLLHIIERRR